MPGRTLRPKRAAVPLLDLYPIFQVVRDRLVVALRGAGFHVQDPPKGPYGVYPCFLSVAAAPGELTVAVDVEPIRSPGGRRHEDFRADSFRVSVRWDGQVLREGWTTIPTDAELTPDHPRVVKIAALLTKELRGQEHKVRYDAGVASWKARLRQLLAEHGGGQQSVTLVAPHHIAGVAEVRVAVRGEDNVIALLQHVVAWLDEGRTQ